MEIQGMQNLQAVSPQRGQREAIHFVTALSRGEADALPGDMTCVKTLTIVLLKKAVCASRLFETNIQLF